MKKVLLGTIFLALAIVVPVLAMAEVNISIGVPLPPPPPIPFAAPPEVVVMPDTEDVYVVPEIDVDMFFWNGWWWRPWEGRWYRSRYYDRAWVYYNSVPRFYYDVDPGWRGFYRDHDWHGHRWNYERIPHRRLQNNWKGWHDNRHWERGRTWGVQGYRPRPLQQRRELRHEREVQYRQRPEVQRHQEQMREHQKLGRVERRQGQPQREHQVQPPSQQQRRQQVQQPQRQQAPQQQHSQPRNLQRQGGSRGQGPQSHGKVEGGEGEHRK